MSGWTGATVSRLLDVSFSLPTSLFRWPRLLTSYLTPPPRWSSSIASLTLISARIRLPDVDDVVWSVISAMESVALVSFLCFFFVFCGCTL
ncbi:hypothetical protein SASPL_102359 [Salvia splendens]|uniref:Uncharacterized protein n=1 Tax=Salvia splendens TaxID=180675 RepID=A0A8X9ACS4_SALSN|nr:hypothetical protein SASPL_102359 [Salvia splendens]